MLIVVAALLLSCCKNCESTLKLTFAHPELSRATQSPRLFHMRLETFILPFNSTTLSFKVRNYRLNNSRDTTAQTYTRGLTDSFDV
uniref:Putative triose-phosphate transporter family n=1 Tax=Ixodes ricinus TaxID=34613 RepID=A0A0K8RLZ9_IXORI